MDVLYGSSWGWADMFGHVGLPTWSKKGEIHHKVLVSCLTQIHWNLRCSWLEHVHKSSTSPFIHDRTKLIQVQCRVWNTTTNCSLGFSVYQTPRKLKSHGKLPLKKLQQNLEHLTNRSWTTTIFHPFIRKPCGGQTNLRLSSACSCCCASGKSTGRHCRQRTMWLSTSQTTLDEQSMFFWEESTEP